MNDVTIGKGNMSGKGVYAVRDFKEGEVVMKYQLKPITFQELKALPPEDYATTHNVNGQIYLYPEPTRYVSHSEDPNVRNDHGQQANIAIKDIGRLRSTFQRRSKRGERTCCRMVSSPALML